MPPYRKRLFSSGVETGDRHTLGVTRLAQVTPRPPRRVRGRADQEGEACGAKHRPEKQARTEGLGGREGGGLRRGAGSAESQDPGEDAAPPGAGRPALPSRGREGQAGGANPPRGRGLYTARARH